MSENAQEELREGSIAAEDGGVEPTAGSAEIPVEGEAPVLAETVNQVGAPNCVKDDLNDVKVAEDGGKEDMFGDCSDKIENSETHQTGDGKDIVQDTQSKELNNGTEVQELMAKVQNLHSKLEKTIAEKRDVEQHYEEERTALKRELKYLCCQLRALNLREPSLEKIMMERLIIIVDLKKVKRMSRIRHLLPLCTRL